MSTKLLFFTTGVNSIFKIWIYQKPKKRFVDFGNDYNVGPPVVIDKECVEIVDSYKYPGSVIDSKLKGDQNLEKKNKESQTMFIFL